MTFIALKFTPNTRAQQRRADLALGLKSDFAKRIFGFRLKLAGVKLRAAMLPRTPADTGKLRASHDYAVDPSGLQLFVFNRSAYAPYVHEGRAPGKRPPIDALLPWARRKVVNARLEPIRIAAVTSTGITPKLRKTATKSDLKKARTLAFLVARAIGRRGTKGRPWFADVIRELGYDVAEKAVLDALADLNDVYGKYGQQLVAEGASGEPGR